MIIDAHHHLWAYSAEEYPWIPPDSALARDHLMPDLEAAVEGTGVTGTIAVQARQTVEETRFLLDTAAAGNLIRAVVGWLPLASPDFAASLETFRDEPRLRGLRHVLQEEPDEFFERPDFNAGLQRMTGTGLRYDLLIYQRQIPQALRLLDRHPDLPVVLDHIAKPEARKGRVEPGWQAGMRELAKREQILGVKFSGLVTEFPPGEADAATIRAYFLETLEIFGPARVMFGTDWPVCLLRLGAYAEWVDQVRLLAASLSPAERQELFSGTAMRAYGLTMA